MAILAEETAPLRAKLEAAEKSLAPVQKAADEAASRLAIARQELELAMSAFRREEERITQARNGAQSAQDRLNEREGNLAEALNMLNGGNRVLKRESGVSGGETLQEALARSSKELAECKNNEVEMGKEVARLRSTMAEAKSSIQVHFLSFICSDELLVQSVSLASHN